MRQGFKKYSDMRQGYFLNLTCDMAINKRQRHATLEFPKIDRRHGDPPSRAPRDATLQSEKIRKSDTCQNVANKCMNWTIVV